MKVFINGEWYDSEKMPIVVKLSHLERIHIMQMDAAADYYGSFPDKLSENMCREVLTKAREKENEE